MLFFDSQPTESSLEADMRSFPILPRALWCLEHAVLFQMPASAINRAGALLKNLWLCREIGWNFKNEQGRIGLIPAFVEDFAADGPFHRLIEEKGLGLQQFATRPALDDPEGVLVSPALILAAIHYNCVYKKCLSIASKSNKPPTLVLHWDGGAEDWDDHWCPLPYSMVRN